MAGFNFNKYILVISLVWQIKEIIFKKFSDWPKVIQTVSKLRYDQ